MFSDDLELQSVQRASLNILVSVASVCEREGLKYYLCGGTLLGAVREKGFIPWDDDIDIMMPRPDYDALIKMSDEKLDKRFKLSYFRIADKGGTLKTHHVQIFDLSIDLERNWTMDPEIIHPWIDIFPLDGLPKSAILRNLHYYRYRFWDLCTKISSFDDNVNVWRTNRPKYQKMVIEFLKKTRFGSDWDTLALMEKSEKTATRYPLNSSELICSFHGLHKRREMIPCSWFKEDRQMLFEGYPFSVPYEYDVFLRNYYGDSYMIPDNNMNYKHNFEIIKKDETV